MSKGDGSIGGQSMEIRFAVEADFNNIRKIANQGQKFHVNLRPDIYMEATDHNPVLSQDQYKEMIFNKNMIVFIDEGKILAYMAFEDKTFLNPLIKKQKILFIDSLSVDENYKHRGISKILMSWIKQYAKENQYVKIELQVSDRNDIAKHLYVTQGFTNKSINMEYFIE